MIDCKVDRVELLRGGDGKKDGRGSKEKKLPKNKSGKDECVGWGGRGLTEWEGRNRRVSGGWVSFKYQGRFHGGIEVREYKQVTDLTVWVIFLHYF